MERNGTGGREGDPKAGILVDGLTVVFSDVPPGVIAVNDLSFKAPDGELVVLLGPSGSGKTSILSCVAGILTPTRGSVHVAGQDVTSLRGRELVQYRRKTVGIVFQSFNLIPSLTALENVACALMIDGVPFRDARELAADLLGKFGLANRLKHRPGNLSGGQKQRVALARALVKEPAIVIADEPTSHLDRAAATPLIDLLAELRRPGRVLLVATHDERLLRVADRVVDLDPQPDDEPTESLTAGLRSDLGF